MTNLLQIRSKSGSLEVKYKEFNTILHSQSFNHNNNLSTTTIFLNSEEMEYSERNERKQKETVSLCWIVYFLWEILQWCSKSSKTPSSVVWNTVSQLCIYCRAIIITTNETKYELLLVVELFLSFLLMVSVLCIFDLWPLDGCTSS